MSSAPQRYRRLTAYKGRLLPWVMVRKDTARERLDEISARCEAMREAFVWAAHRHLAAGVTR